MYGILGGLLEVVNILGGIVLWCLIGQPAWKKNTTARWSRILVGSIPSGFILGVVGAPLLYYFLPVDLLEDTPPLIWAIIGFSTCGVFVVALLASILEGLRRWIVEEDRSEP